uniref:Uncharacterized protein n=1 Tax=viral metagenome TaxID=1070528 RepID=A0A6M3JPN3_9ZZZZ
MILQSTLSNSELLSLYGYEPYKDSTIEQRWAELTESWSIGHSHELGVLRQIMLQIHQDLCPDESSWRRP